MSEIELTFKGTAELDIEPDSIDDITPRYGSQAFAPRHLQVHLNCDDSKVEVEMVKVWGPLRLKSGAVSGDVRREESWFSFHVNGPLPPGLPELVAEAVAAAGRKLNEWSWL